ncbi:MAG: hypothetical protein FD180_5101 [Planctomycetota bacterium]|nr:MAG: hypothetical protein FD180_5101 [Planctomycetota bacterium]
MKAKFAIGLALTAVLCAFLARPLWSEDEGSDKGGGGGGMPDTMKPGPEHEAMAKWAGKWEVAGKFWMDPSGKATDSKGSAEFEVIMEGRYFQQDYKGDLMGMPYTGMEIIGYDRVMKRYTAHWVDSISTSATYLTGTSKDGGKTIEFTGKMPDPEKGGEVDTRWVHTAKGDDSFVFDMFLQSEGKESKIMELTYTRKK